MLCSVSSIVLRGATEGMLDDVERAVDDGINAYKVSGGRTRQALGSSVEPSSPASGLKA